MEDFDSPKSPTDIYKTKKLTPQEQIEHTMKEMQEVIAYLDYSFERAYTVKEREYIIAYRVRLTSLTSLGTHRWNPARHLIAQSRVCWPGKTGEKSS